MLAATSGRPRHWRRALVLAAAGVLVAGGGLLAWWISRPPAFHEPAGVSALVPEIARAVPASLREHDVPGASVAVVRQGEVRWTGAYGVADTRTRMPMTPETVMQIASVSKPLAAYTVVRLARAGRVELDAPIERLTAGWRLPESEFDAQEVTLRRLLSHTAGINVSGYQGLRPGSPLPSTEASLAGASGAGTARIVDARGREWRYSGGGYTLGQLAVERATGEPYSRVVERQVLRPLGMARTGFDCTTSESPPRGAASGHDAAGKPMPRLRYAEQAAAGVCSTAGDMGRFAAALMRGPIATAMAAPAPATDGKYGLGLHIERLRDGTKRLWHDGSNRGWQAQLEVFPDRDWALVMLTNGDNGRHVIADVARLIVR
jgi:CubicO group peptidase (beta-lactamase class C family)